MKCKAECWMNADIGPYCAFHASVVAGTPNTKESFYSWIIGFKNKLAHSPDKGSQWWISNDNLWLKVSGQANVQQKPKPPEEAKKKPHPLGGGNPMPSTKKANMKAIEDFFGPGMTKRMDDILKK